MGQLRSNLRVVGPVGGEVQRRFGWSRELKTTKFWSFHADLLTPQEKLSLVAPPAKFELHFSSDLMGIHFLLSLTAACLPFDWSNREGKESFTRLPLPTSPAPVFRLFVLIYSEAHLKNRRRTFSLFRYNVNFHGEAQWSAGLGSEKVTWRKWKTFRRDVDKLILKASEQASESAFGVSLPLSGGSKCS